MNNYPKLRYKGFSDSWGSESLNTNAKIITGKTPRTSDLSLWQNDVDFVTPTDIVGKYQKQVDRKVTDTPAIQSIILEPGAIAYTCIASIGKMSIITKKSITNQQINSIIVSNNDTEYIYYNLLRNEGRIRSMAGDFGMAMINKTDFSNISITLPSYMEQKKISSMLAKIDILIKEKEKEIEVQTRIQKCLANKLLANGTEPLLRYKGFGNKYTNLLLGEICSISTGNKDVKDGVENGKYPFYIRSKNIIKIDTYSFDGEAILIGGDGNISDLIHYTNGKFDYHQRVYKLSNFVNSGKYTFHYLNKNIGRELIKNSANTTVDSVRLPTLKNFKMLYPTNQLEQNKVSDLLSKLDILTNVKNTELIMYKEIKGYILKKILV